MALHRVDEFTRRQKSLPIDLGRIASACKVKAIEFQPLLVSGGLAVVSDGFYIYVRYEPEPGGPSGADLTQLFCEDGTGKTLPRSIAKPARFTIAHEIAHTLLYDTSKCPPIHREKVDGTGLRGLEHTCNVVAAAMMLPEAFIEESSRNRDFLDPDQLESIAEEALISRVSLVWRFRTLRRVEHPMGLIVSLQRKGGLWQIVALSSHYAYRGLFETLDVGSEVTKLINDDAFWLTGGTEITVNYDVKSNHGPIPFVFRTTTPSRVSQSCIMTARPLIEQEA